MSILAFVLATIILDIEIILLHLITSLTYDYMIVTYSVALVISGIISTMYFIRKIKKIKKNLTRNEEIIDIEEYFMNLGIADNTLIAMEYIIVGLTQICNLFTDGTLTDFLINNSDLHSINSILLQVLTFFPSESRKMDILFKKLCTKRKLTLSERFLIYQVARIKTRRLITDTKSTLEVYSKMKLRNDECKEMIKSFWDLPTCKLSFLSAINRQIDDLDSYFNNSLQENPNNLIMTSEYADFLVECVADFDKAIYEKVRGEYIQNGTNFNVDTSFRSLVNHFPDYLIKGIVDPKGRMIRREIQNPSKTDSDKTSGSSGSGSSGSSKGTANSSISIDHELQDMICKKIIRDSRVRLAFHRSIQHMQPKQMYQIMIFSFFIFFIAVSFFIASYLHLTENLKWRRSSYKDFRLMALALDKTYNAAFLLTLDWAAKHGRYDKNVTSLGNISIDDMDTNVIVRENKSAVFRLISYQEARAAQTFMKGLLDNIAILAAGEYVQEIVPNLMGYTSVVKLCSKSNVTHSYPTNIKDQFTLVQFLIMDLAGEFHMNKDIPNIYKNDLYCQLLENSITMSDKSEETVQRILEFNIKRANKNENDAKLWLYVGVGSLFVLSIFPMIVILASYYRFVNKTIRLLLLLPQNVKDDAKKPLMIEHNETLFSTANLSKKSLIMELSIVAYFIGAFGLIAIYGYSVYNVLDFNDDITSLLKWYYLSALRNVAVSEVRSDLIHVVMLNGSLPNNFITADSISDELKHHIDLVKKTNDLIVNGDEDFPKLVGYDEKYDNIQFNNLCDLGRDPKSIHDSYACNGVQQQLSFLESGIRDIINDPSVFEGSVSDELPTNIIHLLNSHFHPISVQAAIRLRDLLEERFDGGMKVQLILLIVGIGLSINIFVLPWFIRSIMNEDYRLFLMFFRHLQPQVILDTHEIIDFVRGTTRKHHKEEMTISKSIVYNAKECIVVTNHSGIIDIVNQSVTDNLSLTPDQILGQSIINIISQRDQERLNSQMQLMIAGQGPKYWQDHIMLVNDNADEVPFAVTMIGMRDKEESEEIASIVFILENEVEKIKKEKLAEESKQKSEKLLYQIMPKDIVVRLNRGETDITFIINSATIFFIDIVKFSHYSSTLTPSEIMSNLSLVFENFDRNVAEFETITKIKLIGDVYMAAAGLFNNSEDNSINHAEDAVKCCIQCAKLMEDINLKLNSSLEVRIGCNSGGPLIGGVLGSDKPAFDIIGDPINIAARLQSTDIPGNVQISETTKEMIQSFDFEIEERGMIYLKGKGERKTYFVSLKNQSNLDSSFALSLQK
ncbi:Adenylate and Guanylate cyclase catalytic domain containing protein [Trichomonas vaginalis G3]|uniref:Adenylate and Guanylate cyclase catalytic domain containing protein n=1 Tax=Trichomonas vaginalis (strain ATCC PRA-98 / G3) TaxID=412133 RepID=A2FET1_TRIV3|nr:guanylate cyclase protein [Trichomonas vaginalis G3]EAX96578.1 Adenylate and Guanylate cyclase catalytic domain containing protein [Trichomonas vaginalis G3]KAI5485904.1 guanylate cyclase protein [Trichomonas vaginalis G3]|eukprot:XP_001309508.1 Adenylate and Guanylate cyclase catalytic domain containing protein [Trichomonas vaginalis G3]